jgi:hypothetical protein
MSTPKSPLVRRKRAEVAALSKYRDPGHPELLTAKRDLRALRLADYVTEVLSQAPPLTPEQRETIIGLLRAGGGSS